MSYAQVGTCTTCGAPIYAESPWWGITPPPSQHSCGCHGGYTTVGSPTTDTVDLSRPNQYMHINPPWNQEQAMAPSMSPSEVSENSTKKAIEELGDMLESEDLLELSEVDKLKSEVAGLSSEIEALGKLVVDFINHSTEKKKPLKKKDRQGTVISD